MDQAAARNSNGIQPAPAGRGGARPGAGRPKSLAATAATLPADAWLRFETLLRKAAAKEITPAVVRKLAKDDPWRFLERVLMPLIGMRYRTPGARLGVSLGEGATRQQFVLDLGEPDGRTHDAGDALDALLGMTQGQVIDHQPNAEGRDQDRMA